LDGTLYHQTPLRYLIACELSLLPFMVKPYRLAVRQWRSLRHFRRVREELRDLGSPPTSLAELQYAETAKRSGMSVDEVERVIAEWIHRRPLKYLRLCRRRGVETFFSFLKSRGLQIGVFSDYPVADKLCALGLSESVTLTLCATDPEINAFKPHPKGFWHACALWGIAPEETLYVGDRLEVDAAGAMAAGMPCALLANRLRRPVREGYNNSTLIFSSFSELHYAIINRLEG
jgi:HAD superfamily hydrolase (TIGR01549 family)